MTNKVLSRIMILLVAICMCITMAMLSYAEEPGTTSSQSPASSAVSSTEPPVESEPAVSSTPSEIVSSEPSVSSVPQVVSSAVAVTSSKQSNSSSKKQTTSSKKHTTSSKKSTSTQTYSQSTDNGNTNYTEGYTENNGSTSDEWEGGKTELVSSNTSSSKKLSSHMTNPKKEILKWITIPVVVGLACVGVLVYTNMYLFKKGKYQGKHSGKGKKGKSGAAPTKKYEPGKPHSSVSQEVEAETETDDSDPFSADNFFNFDNDK